MKRLKTEGVAHHQQNDKKQNADAHTPCASTTNESENAINAPRNQKHVENLDSNDPGRLFGEADERLEEFFQRSYELKPIAPAIGSTFILTVICPRCRKRLPHRQWSLARGFW